MDAAAKKRNLEKDSVNKKIADLQKKVDYLIEFKVNSQIFRLERLNTSAS